MTYKILMGELRKAITDAISSLNLSAPSFSVGQPPDPSLGDISSNVAFLVSQGLHLTPQEVAIRLSELISQSKIPLIKHVEAHKSGYLNFYIDYKEFSKLTLQNCMAPDYGVPNVTKRKISIEHTSVNPNKALHIGHVRNVVIGDTIARLMAFVGHNTTILNYIDDTGTQVADIVLGIMDLNFPLTSSAGEKFDHYIGDVVYVEVNKLYEKNPQLLQRRKEISKLIEKGEGKEAILASKITTEILKEQLKTCWRIGAEYDLLNFESHILKVGYWERIFDELKKKGIVKLQQGGKFDGCWVMQGPEEEEKVLVRSDGTTVYAAKDIPYAAWKLGIVPDLFEYSVFCRQPSGKILWATEVREEMRKEKRPSSKEFCNADMTIAVIDVGQSRLQKFVKSALLALSPKGEGYVHLAYEKVFLSAKTAKQILGADTVTGGAVSMKGRSGVYINADLVLDELKKKALEETRKRNLEKSDEEIDRIAEQIAVSALRYELLKQDLNKVIVFDIDESLKLLGDTGPYLMYTFARANSILRKANINSNGFIIPAELDARERALVLLISRLELEIEEALNYLTPKPLTRYAHHLATAFNNFYENCPVLSAEENVARFRLELVKAFRVVMGKVLDLIGIKHPESI